MAGSVSLPDLIKAIRGQIPNDKCDLLEDLVQKLQKRQVRLNRQEFLHKVRDIAGEDAPALRQALKQLAHDKVPSGQPGTGDENGGAAATPGALVNGITLGQGAANNALAGADSAGAAGGMKPEPLSASFAPGANGDSAIACQACAKGLTTGGLKSGEMLHAGTASSAPGVSYAAPGSASAAASSSSSLPQQRQQQQRLEVAAAAVLVHAASCSDAACPVPHCNKMKKIHAHFLECTTSDCAICKKLRPLTYIHAKHCHTAPGEQCVISYCARAKRELQALLNRNQHAQRPVPIMAQGVSSGSDARLAAPLNGVLPGGAGASAPVLGSNCASWSGSNGSLGGLDSSNVQAQAHYLLVLAHVMKCANANCSVTECATTKALVTNHTRSCRAGDACTYPRCALSKRLMRHHRECPDQNCPVCLPLRRRLQAAKNVRASQPASIEGAAPLPKRGKTKKKKEEAPEPTDENIDTTAAAAAAAAAAASAAASAASAAEIRGACAATAPSSMWSLSDDETDSAVPTPARPMPVEAITEALLKSLTSRPSGIAFAAGSCVASMAAASPRGASRCGAQNPHALQLQ